MKKRNTWRGMRGGIIIKNCRWCNKEFEAQRNLVKKGYGKYCSLSCRSKGVLIEFPHLKEISKENAKHLKPYLFGKGKNHPQWQNGIGKLPYPFEWTETLKESIRQRDDYTCQLCGKAQGDEIKRRNRKLTVHHIDYDKNNLDPKNLITLCGGCNSKVNFDRLDWMKHFEYKEAK